MYNSVDISGAFSSKCFS